MLNAVCCLPPKVTPASTEEARILRHMGVSVSVLASGSRGNSAMVCSATTRILVDAGISCRETFKRMKAAGEDPSHLSAIVITHEHSDHVYGLATLAKKLSIPIFMTGRDPPLLVTFDSQCDRGAAASLKAGSLLRGTSLRGGRY